MFPKVEAGAIGMVEKAYEVASKALEGHFRENGRPFLDHPIGVAKIAADEIGLPAECLAAVFLHEAMRFGSISDPKEFIKGYDVDFPNDVLTIVDGLNKIATINPRDTALEAENYKKLIVSYSRDPRVVVLKLADRLEVMRNLSFFSKASRERKVLETSMLYIPLAHQLGLYNMKSEMEDIYLRCEHPEQYRAITNKLKSTQGERQRLMTQFIEPLKTKLSDEGISYKLKVRTKTAYSIWKKMCKQNVPFEGVYDVFAIRFIIDCEGSRKDEHDLCWKVFSYVTEQYKQDTNRLRDWLSKPKANGYECLHITVQNADGAYLEVQIRTKRMDEWAENGLASHWSYKGIRTDGSLDGWLRSVRQTLEHPSSAVDPDYAGEELPTPPSNEIFVYTPSGELRRLCAGATVLDFAFEIHSNLGVKCTGARVNGKAVSIREKLRTGDVVEIMSGKNQKPSSDWLNFVASSKAKQRIRRYFSELEFKAAADGKEILERRLKNWKLEASDDVLMAFMAKKGYKTLNAFYSAVGDGSIDIAEVKAYITSEQEKEEAAPMPEKKASSAPDSAIGSDDLCVLDAKNIKNLDYKMSRCCNPVFGDDVFGFISIKDGLKIHRISCPNASRLIDMYPYRIKRVKWSENPSTGSFQASLSVIADHDSSVLGDIMAVVGSFKASIRSCNVTENLRSGTYSISLKISVPSNLELDKVISQIRNIKSVNRVSRG